MPQLNPTPWLMIFLLVWMVFMFLFLNKSLTSTCQNTPSMKQMKETSPFSWNWPWY